MTLSHRAKWKGAIAICVGLPGTIIFLPMTLIGILGGVEELSRATPLWKSPLPLVWGGAGLAGLCGFWAWTVLGPNAKTTVRTTVAVCVLMGMCAVAPFAFLFVYNYLVSAAAAFGLIIGCAISVWLVLPDSPLNPDAPQERRAG
jgi:hypothetical protein